MQCFAVFIPGWPWCHWVPLTTAISEPTAQEKSQVKGACSLQCSREQNRSVPSGAEEQMWSFRYSAFSHLSPTAWQIGHPSKRLCLRWPHWHGLFPLLAGDQRDDITILLSPLSRWVGGGWEPTQKGTIYIKFRSFSGLTWYACLLSASGVKSCISDVGGRCDQANCLPCMVLTISPHIFQLQLPLSPSPFGTAMQRQPVVNLEEIYSEQPGWTLGACFRVGGRKDAYLHKLKMHS